LISTDGGDHRSSAPIPTFASYRSTTLRRLITSDADTGPIVCRRPPHCSIDYWRPCLVIDTIRAQFWERRQVTDSIGSSGAHVGRRTILRAVPALPKGRMPMTVRAILARKGHDVVTIAPAATLSEAVKLLSERRIGAVIVTGQTIAWPVSCQSVTLCA